MRSRAVCNACLKRTNAPVPETRLFQPLLETWKQYVQQANETTRQTLEQVGIDADPIAWRRGWFDALSHQTDEFFRSPTFLGMLKRHVDSVIDALQRSRPVEGGGTSSDRLGGLEQEMSVRIDQIERDLERIEQKIGCATPPEFASTSPAEQFEASEEARRRLALRGCRPMRDDAALAVQESVGALR